MGACLVQGGSAWRVTATTTTITTSTTCPTPTSIKRPLVDSSHLEEQITKLIYPLPIQVAGHSITPITNRLLTVTTNSITNNIDSRKLKLTVFAVIRCLGARKSMSLKFSLNQNLKVSFLDHICKKKPARAKLKPHLTTEVNDFDSYFVVILRMECTKSLKLR